MAKKSPPALPWLPPGTASTWVCRNGHINLRTTTKCRSCK